MPATMAVHASMDPRLPLGDVADYARRVERLGFDGLHLAEMIHDPFSAAALALAATDRLRVTTAVALAFVRSPMATALAAWDLAHLSGGRFDLGLGSQVRANVEERYGADFDRPVGRMSDHVAAVRACFESFENGTRLRHEGPFVHLSRLQSDFRPPPLGDVRAPDVLLGAVGNQMVSLAGRCGDGLITHPTNSHPVDLEQRMLPALRSGAEKAGRPSPPVVVSPMVATGPDPAAVDVARQSVRRRLAFLYSTPAYAPTLALLGVAEIGGELRRRVRAEDDARLEAALPDVVLDAVVPSAPWSDLAADLQNRFGGLVDGLVLRPPADDAADREFAAVVAEFRGG